MRLALLSDIHGNREALDACLADVASAAPDAVACLGDVVGYGADPAYCVERFAELAADGATVLLGNHDEAAVRGPADMSADAARAIEWTARRLAPAHLAFLAGLPLEARSADLHLVHASAASPAAWAYVLDAASAAECLAATDARLTVCGHTHRPALFSTLERTSGRRAASVFHPPMDRPVPLSRIRRHVAVAGAVGQPRDDDPRAAWLLLDTDRGEATWRRIPYDVDAAARKIVAAGLPARLAARLGRGI